MDIRNRIKEHKILKRLFHYILANLNKINLQSKLLVMQILCVILPLILTHYNWHCSKRRKAAYASRYEQYGEFSKICDY